MRRIARFVVCLLILVATTGLAHAQDGGELRRFAAEAGLADVAGFVETVTALRTTGAMPLRYLNKKDAAAAGWRPGQDLCQAAPGRVIGGDTFGNREGRLPLAPGRRWREADLDFACGARGPKRLVWSSDGLIFITLDHYRTFRAVPR
ncbi:MAG: hypothetical protein HY057_01265 [Rhodospirillales bacterium]|nr:hypothetical protein [Rhodospirillales bacterium]